MRGIQKLKSERTGMVSYRVQIRVPGRPSESATFTNKKDAEAWRSSILTAISESRHFPHAAARRTSFDDLAADYLKAAELSAKERKTRTRHLKWWRERFAGLAVAEVTADRIGKARDALAALPKRSPATVNRHIATLSATFTFAVRERHLLSGNPCRAITRKREPRGRTRFLSDAERTALLNACAESEWPALRALVLLAISTGARRGELIGLRWEDIDIKAGRALVRETKNDEQRVLPLAGKALEAVRELKLKNAKRSAYVFPADRVALNPETGQPELDGPYEWFDRHWYAALKDAGIEGFRFHDLRHTTASMLAKRGASLLEIADVLGHKTLAMVKRYSHLCVDHKHDLIKRMVKDTAGL